MRSFGGTGLGKLDPEYIARVVTREMRSFGGLDHKPGHRAIGTVVGPHSGPYRSRCSRRVRCADRPPPAGTMIKALRLYRESASSGHPGLAASGLEQSGLEALTTQPRTPAVATVVERTFMFRGGAGAMAVSRSTSRLRGPGPASTLRHGSQLRRASRRVALPAAGAAARHSHAGAWERETLSLAAFDRNDDHDRFRASARRQMAPVSASKMTAWPGAMASQYSRPQTPAGCQ